MRFPDLTFPLPEWLDSVLPPPDRRIDDDASRMRVALSIALANIEHATGGPFGAAIFDADDGRLISAGMNLVTARNCSVLHAEIVAIMVAQRALRSYDLGAEGRRLVLVSSVEPCAMCLGAIHWSGVRRLVCGGRDEDARAIGFDEGPKPPEGILILQRNDIAVVRDVLRNEALAVLNRYVALGGPIYNPARPT